MPDRATLTGILFVLRTGIQWEMLPLAIGCGWASRAGDVCGIGRRRARMDSASLAAKRGATTITDAADRPAAVAASLPVLRPTVD